MYRLLYLTSCLIAAACGSRAPEPVHPKPPDAGEEPVEEEMTLLEAAAGAVLAHDEGCATGEIPDCIPTGIDWDGAGAGTTDEEARVVYGKACDQSVGEACLVLGFMLMEGQGGDADAAAARDVFDLACSAGEMYGCLQLGILWHEGEGGREDTTVARGYYDAACTGDLPEGCFMLGAMWDAGVGGDQDTKTALDLLEKACRGGVMDACSYYQSIVGEN